MTEPVVLCPYETMSLKSKHTEQVEKRRSGSMWKSMTDQPGIHAIEAKIQARRSISIVITRLRQKVSRRHHTLVLVLGCDKSRQGISIGMEQAIMEL